MFTSLFEFRLSGFAPRRQQDLSQLLEASLVLLVSCYIQSNKTKLEALISNFPKIRISYMEEDSLIIIIK
jgi:hypothetical protein